MGGARALIASLGASISLVAGAAIALLLMSVVVAYPGFVGDDDAPAASRALVIEDQSPTAVRSRREQARVASSTVLIKSTPAPRKAPARASRAQRPRSAGSPVTRPKFNPGIRDLNPPPAQPATSAPPAPPAPAAGDGVRDVGDTLSATVKGTGHAAGQAAQVLGPPVSQAVQDVLDLLTSVLEGATGGLAGALDKTLPAS